MYRSNENFDYSSAELVGLYIDDYKMFKKEFISLHPLFEAEKKNKMVSLKEINIKDPFLEKKLNVKIIVGDNGTGKSTILNLLKVNDGTAILLFKDKNKEFASTKNFSFYFNTQQVYCHIEDDLLFESFYAYPSDKIILQGFSPMHASRDVLYSYLDDSENNCNMLVYYYSKNSIVFDFSDTNKLFTNFEICHINKMNLEMAALPYNFRYVFNDEIDELFVESPLDALCVCSVVKNAPFYCSEPLKYDYTEKEKIDLKDFFNMIRIKKELNWEEYDQISNDLKEFFFLKENGRKKEYAFDAYDSIHSQMDELRRRIEKWFEKAKIKIAYSFFYYFRPYKVIEGKHRYISDLSTGEKRDIYNKLQLYPFYKNLSEKRCFYLLLDEPDASYHPKWSRCFWKDFIKTNDFVKSIERKSVNRNISIIVATHSPFLLSDAFSNNLIRLCSNGDGSKTKAVKMESTFAGNIGEMYYTHSFMESTIGALAEDKIKEWISKIQDKESSDVEINEIIDQINQVEDKILRGLLLDKVKYRSLV